MSQRELVAGLRYGVIVQLLTDARSVLAMTIADLSLCAPACSITDRTCCATRSALIFAKRGAPARAIQELAGHQNLTTTQRYMQLSPAALDSAIRLLETAAEPANYVRLADASAVNSVNFRGDI